jgi:uncharacterized membrane protein YkvA (DUF1232 family)
VADHRSLPAGRKRETARRQLAEVLRALPNLAKLVARLAVHPAVPAREKAILAATVAYLALPIDLIPDFIPVLGEADDVFLVAVVLQRVINCAGEAVVAQAWDGDQELLILIRKALDAATVFLPRRIRDQLVARASAPEPVALEARDAERGAR